MKAQRKGPGGWAQDMKLKKLKAARAKWLEKQQTQQRPNDDLQLIANSRPQLAEHHDSGTV